MGSKVACIHAWSHSVKKLKIPHILCEPDFTMTCDLNYIVLFSSQSVQCMHLAFL